ncbi:hypothetical protein ACHWQZ_G004813 [Mnemiopsis leidyi]
MTKGDVIRQKCANKTFYSCVTRETGWAVLAQVEATSIDNTVTDILKQASSQSADIDLNTLAPRKANWDLKRDVEKKLAKLERRTKRAMAEMIREKLRSERDIMAGAATGQDTGDDSD